MEKIGPPRSKFFMTPPVVFVHCCLLVSSLHEEASALELSRSDCEPEPVCLLQGRRQGGGPPQIFLG